MLCGMGAHHLCTVAVVCSLHIQPFSHPCMLSCQCGQSSGYCPGPAPDCIMPEQCDDTGLHGLEDPV